MPVNSSHLWKPCCSGWTGLGIRRRPGGDALLGSWRTAFAQPGRQMVCHGGTKNCAQSHLASHQSKMSLVLSPPAQIEGIGIYTGASPSTPTLRQTWQRPKRLWEGEEEGGAAAGIWASDPSTKRMQAPNELGPRPKRPH
jgi:hypothetical protein